MTEPPAPVEPPAPPPAARAAASRTLALAFLFALLVALSWGDLRGVAHAGPDAWPLLNQARAALADPPLLLSEPYLAGSWDGARFLRPGFVGLHAALLAAGGGGGLFLLLALAALWMTALMAGWTIDGATGGRSFAGTLMAGALVAIHPLHVDTLPALARRADLFAGAFIAATVALLLSSRARHGSLRPLAAVICAAAAPLFKETGLLAAPLGLLALFLTPGRDDRGPRRFVPALLLAASLLAHVAWRFAVLGTLGRYDVAERGVPATRRLGSLVEGLVAHQGLYAAGAGATALLLAALVATIAGRARGKARERSREAAAWTVTLAWLGATAILLASSERCRMRHAVALLPPASIAAGLWLARLRTQPASRLRQASTVLLVSGLLLAVVPGSPLLHDSGPWITSAAVAERVVGASRSAVKSALETGSAATATAGRFRITVAPGERGFQVAVAPFPYRAAPAIDRREPRVDGAMILMPYSIEAAIRWQHPGLAVRAVPRGSQWAVTREMLDAPPR